MKNILVIAALVLVTLYGIIITINYVDINTKKVEMYDQIPVNRLHLTRLNHIGMKLEFKMIMIMKC